MSVKRKQNGLRFCSQIPEKKRKAKNSEDGETNCMAGTIQRVILKNFMCHSLLEIDFNSNVTFVTGRNGSGKSAILTALVVGLGGRASLTNRGNSTKGFIKVGKNSGSVQITICNSGMMAYKPNVYGNCIVVQRTFNATGSSSYKVMSENGEVISKQAREVRNITYALNIQIENPVCILNQDTSRNFLSSSDPKHKFELFMKATMLDTLMQEYAKISTNRRSSQNLFDERKTVLQQLEAQMNNWKNKLEQHKGLSKMKENLAGLQGELLWSQVKDAEGELETHRSRVGNFEQVYKDALEDTNKKKDKLEALKEKIKSLEQQLKEVKDEIIVKKRPQEDIRQSLIELRQKYNDKMQQKSGIERAVNTQRNNCINIQREIENHIQSLEQVEREKIERSKKLGSLEETLTELENIIQTSRNDLFQTESDLGKKEERIASLKSDVFQIDQNIAKIKSDQESLKSVANNSLALYGRDMQRVLTEIERNASSFRKTPRGPIGSYVTLKDKKWALAVESYLTPSLMKAFVVDNVHDNKLLVDIFRRCWHSGPKPNIITTKFYEEVHDVSRNLVRPADADGCISIYDTLKVSDPVIMNCLIDQRNVESVLLIKDDQKAQELLSDAVRVPRNCSMGITANGDRYYPDPNYRSYGSKYRQAQYLQVDMKGRERLLAENLNSCVRNKQALMEQLRELQEEKKGSEEVKQALRRKLGDLTDKRRRLNQQLDELKLSIEPETNSVQNLQNELEEIKKSLVASETELEKVEEDINEIKEAIAEYNQRLQSVKDVCSHLEERIEPLERQIMSEKTKEIQFKAKMNATENQIDESKRKLEQAKSEMEKKDEELGVIERQATTFCDRMEELRSVPEIMNNIRELQKTIRTIESDIESPQDIESKYNEAVENHLKSAEMMNYLDRDVVELKKAVKERKRHLVVTLDHFKTNMQLAFAEVLQYRQFEGSINIDETENKLDLVVIPQQGSQGQTKTTNLSGGERSFSTVAFLYSLWQCTRFPFYFLDEFDVYMDKMNRTKVMEILLDHARGHCDSQFVFLTPQDVSFIKDDGVTIFRLQDPERTNGTVTS